MESVKIDHFIRAIDDIGSHGDNDMLPFDIDTIFISDSKDKLAKIAFCFFERLEKDGKTNAGNILNSTQIYSERLLSPTGASGFRISTKIHPFWNIYLNGIAIAIAEKNEVNRSPNAHSYRFVNNGSGIFDRDKSWRAYKEATIKDPALDKNGAVVIQTDISSFYEHIYHHRIENCINDLFGPSSTVSTQIDRLLSQLSSGRSFGLPVGGQCSRVLAELLMTSIDQILTLSKLKWHRYVDDFTLIADSQAEAYRAISILSNALADYGLSLNRTKTTILKAQHYKNFVHSQLFTEDDESSRLKKIDLHFDPYSDNPVSDYEDLVETVEKLNVQTLLDLEIHKSQPDTFLINQISRTLKLHDPALALQLCRTLISPENLHSFRGSFSTIIKGVISIRTDDKYKKIYKSLDEMVDEIIIHSEHLLLPEANCLHYLRALRVSRTDKRASYVHEKIQESSSETIRRACFECIRNWRDRPSFISARNKWSNFTPEVQRILWLASFKFGDDGSHFRKQVKNAIHNSWSLGIEQKGKSSFSEVYVSWCEEAERK
ncbi:RNA-directed DNA polymerase [Serratia sp. Je.1.23.a]|uniref:RNA-directed DNA polymerase n=1 Tax=Serratia sp. Je.1.23.a TaxID=3142841 RepID=UPI003DA8DE02